MEGNGPTATMYKGDMTGKKKSIAKIISYPAITGAEQSIVYDPFSRKVYTLSNNKVQFRELH